MDNWENMRNLTHTLDKIYLTGILWVQTKIAFLLQKIMYVIVFAIIIINFLAIATVNTVTVIKIVDIIIIMGIIVMNVISFSRKSYFHYRGKDKLRPVLY